MRLFFEQKRKVFRYFRYFRTNPKVTIKFQHHGSIDRREHSLSCTNLELSIKFQHPGSNDHKEHSLSCTNLELSIKFQHPGSNDCREHSLFCTNLELCKQLNFSTLVRMTVENTPCPVRTLYYRVSYIKLDRVNGSKLRFRGQIRKFKKNQSF